MRTGSRARLWAALPVALAWSCAASAGNPAAPRGPAPAIPQGASESGLPLPRYVSLKADRVNLRTGPGTEYPTAWVYRRAGLPLEVVSEFEGWRKVRDSEGATGWVVQSLVSGRRTALVTPWNVKGEKARPQVSIRNSDSESARAVAIVEAGTIVSVQSCDGRWCHVAVDRYRGYLPQKDLWGVYENEVVK